MASLRAQYHRWMADGVACEPTALAACAPPPGGLDGIWRALEALRDAELCDDVAIDPDRVLLAYAPTAALVGAALTSAAHVRHADREPGAACIDAMFLECGEGDAARHRGNRYRGLLADHGLALPDPASRAFVDDPRLRDEDFALALAGLRLPTDASGIAAEALGFHAAATVLGPPAVVRRAAPHAPALHTSAAALARARRCLAAATSWPRAWHGVQHHLAARRAWIASFHAAPPPSIWRVMHDLVARKAHHARGHHARITLASRPLDDWFAEARHDPTALLTALARSPLLVPGDPDRSPLATTLIDFGGPMFGVFTDAERLTVRAWISALAEAPHQPCAPTPDPPPPAPPALHPPRTFTAPQLYHHLLHTHDVAAARDHAARTLRAAPDRPQDFPRTHHDLAAWVDAHLQAQHLGDDDPPPDLTRADVLWLLTQLAPSALVDGAWLQGVTTPALSTTPAAALLFRIYRDELGAGHTHQHHGNVLRAALAAHAVHLPACDSPDFAAHPAFVPAAFAMPAYWLAIAAAGATHTPELLGLNLAVEMAGLGRSYRQAIRLLRRHAIDPLFFELHNSIDNAAVGHTAWSVQAIELHMQALATRDPGQLARTWRRVRRGHASYASVSGRLVRALAVRLGPRLGLRWLRRRVAGLFTRTET